MERITIVLMVFAIIATLVFAAWGAVRITKDIQFQTNCIQYLQRAVISSTTDLAKENLKVAIDYLNAHNLTKGISSIFLKQPGNDIGFFYNNLTKAYDELNSINDDATSLEKSNVLMKLRESITGNSEGSLRVVYPDGIEIYPYNQGFFWWGIISFIATIGLWVATLKPYMY